MATEKRRVSPANKFAVRSGKSEIKARARMAKQKKKEEEKNPLNIILMNVQTTKTNILWQ